MYRLLNVDGRAALEHDGEWHDLGRLGDDEALSDPMVAVARHAELADLADRCRGATAGGAVADAHLGPPVPAPSQVFAIGLNYRDHAAEAGMEPPPAPLTFTKYPSCIAGPHADIELSGTAVDWEAEIVVVIGAPAHRVDLADAWSVVAGLTLGQDISDRTVQMTGNPPQFSLGKSFPAYGPLGPAMVPPAAFADPDDIGLWCDVAGERVQDSRTSRLIFPVASLVAYLSSVCPLRPGDLIFTGTPAGVGMARGRFLSDGDVITTGAEVIGELSNRCVATGRSEPVWQAAGP